eukprot:jgi/Tetstr1/438527/TSEL_027079.t1
MGPQGIPKMEAVENWEADLAGGTVPDYPHPASAPATLTEAFLPYPNIPWDMDEGLFETAVDSDGQGG